MLISEPNNDQNIGRVYTKMSEDCSSQNNNANLPGCTERLKFLNDLVSCEDNQEDLNLPYDHLYATNTDDVDLSAIETTCQNTESEVKFLKEWLLMHLELIQHQNEEIATKERTIYVLKQENEMLKERLNYLDRDSCFQVNNLNNHISVKPTVQEMTQDASHIEEDDKSNSLLLNQSVMIDTCSDEESKYIVTSTPDIIINSNTQNCSVPESTSVNCDNTDLQIKVKRNINVPQEISSLVPNSLDMPKTSDETTFCKINSNYIVNSCVEETLNNLRMSIKRKRLCSGSSMLSNNESGNDESLGSRKKKRKISIKDDKILTSGDQYVTQSGEIAVPIPPEVEPIVELTSNNLEVPRWRVKVYTSCYSMEGTENLDDEVYNKRHLRLENDERRRKRWDVQRIREQRMVEKLKQRQERVRSGSKSNCNEPVQSLWPMLEDVKYVEVNEQLPVSAFGAPIPRFTSSEFTLPWLNNPHALSKKASNRKSTIRRKATKR